MGEQRDHQQPFGRDYAGNAAENYQRYFVPVIGAPLASDLIARAAPQPGERVLDIACGTGVVTRLAAERVGPGGKVVGLDLNPGMLAVARSATPPGPAVEWQEAGADSIPLPDQSFDVVTCQVSLQFFPDKPAALAEMHRVLATGGRLAINVPGRIHALFAALDEPIERYIGAEAAAFVRQVFSLNDPDALRGLIEGAGFREVTVQDETMSLRLPPPRDFLWEYIQSTPLTAMVAKVDDERLAALEREVVSQWQVFVEDGGMRYEQDVLIATARK